MQNLPAWIVKCKFKDFRATWRNVFNILLINFMVYITPINNKLGPTNMAGWWQGWPSGESTCLPPTWPGFHFRTWCHMWIEFVGSLLCYERFSPGYSGFNCQLASGSLVCLQEKPVWRKKEVR